MKNQKQKTRKGLTVTEVVVAATLIVSMIGLFAPLTVRLARVWQSTRQYRLALNELANQMERLTCLRPLELDAALPNLTPSTDVGEALPGSKLLGEVFQDEDGIRIKLSLDWDRGANSEPVSIVGWLDFDAAEKSSLATTAAFTEETVTRLAPAAQY